MRLNKLKAVPERPKPPQERRGALKNGSRRFRRTLSLFVIFLGVTLFAIWLWNNLWIVTNGRVIAKTTEIASPLTGRVVALHVRERQIVNRGDLLAEIGVGPVQAELRKAQLHLDTVRSELEIFKRTGLDPLHSAQVVLAETALGNAQQAWRRAQAELRELAVLRAHSWKAAKRSQELFMLRANSREQWEDADLSSRRAQASYEALQATVAERGAEVENARRLLASARRRLDFAEKNYELDILRRENLLKAAEADVERVQSLLVDTQLHTPHKGMVSWVNKTLGEVADHNDVILAVSDPEVLWVETYVKADDLPDLFDGKPAQVVFDGVSGDFEGKVALFYPDQRIEAGVLPVGQRPVRSPTQLAGLHYPVKIVFEERLPAAVAPEMIARVRIRR